jgi:ribosomal protein L21E
MINIETAPVQELRAYAKEEFGLTFQVGTTKAAMLDAVKSALGQDPAKTDSAPQAISKKSRDGKRVTINIHKSANPSDPDPVYVGLNGVGVTIPRGVDVSVLEGYVAILRHAVRKTYHTDQKTGDTIESESHAYPFSVIG